MKVSYNWLDSYIDLPYTPEELEHELTMAGLEVESREFLGSGLEYIVVGRVIETDKHPEKENLQVCQIDFDGEQRQIICGADNVRANIKVPVALPGTELPDGSKVEEIEMENIRSQGMICSAHELGLEDEKQDAIMELPEDFEVGSKFISESGRDDHVYKLDLTPNYARCLGMLGIVRELRGLAEEDLEIKWPQTGVKSRGESPVSVSIEDEKLCPRYTARYLEGVEIKPSPRWLQQRLEAVGIRPINNVVDITNFVMMEYNQPLHAFDFDRISGDEVIVRRAEPGEKLITLDDENRRLTEEDLVIADREKAIGLAGVMGGAETEVTGYTENVLLEAACFDPVSIRRTAQRLALSTDSSHRFEREIDITAIKEASNRACYLLEKYASAEVRGDLVDVYPRPYRTESMELKPQRVNAHLGIDLSGDEMVDMLQDLGFSCQKGDKDLLQVEIPGFRTDVECEAGLIEEIARVYGYNNIDYTRPPAREAGGRTDKQKAEKKVSDFLKGQGLEEALCFSLRPREDDFLPYLEETQGEIVNLKNPLSESFATLRTSLLPGLIESLSHNARSQVEVMGIFELGNVFFEGKNVDKRPDENKNLGLASMGADDFRDVWELDAADFFYLKGIAENLLDDLEINEFNWQRFDHPAFHPGRCAELIIDDEKAGYLGELHPDLIDFYDLPERTSAGEFDFGLLFARSGYREIEYEPLPRHPSIDRDLAFIVDNEVSARELRSAVIDEASSNLSRVRIFDYYRGDQIPDGKKSIALKLKFQNRERTLTEEEIGQDMDNIIERTKKELGASIRGM